MINHKVEHNNIPDTHSYHGYHDCIVVDTPPSDNLLYLIGTDVPLHRSAQTYGGEWAGPCPFCGGRDRFRVWPDHPSGRGRFWCRQCNVRGDAIAYVRSKHGLSFRDAVHKTGQAPSPPSALPVPPSRTDAPSTTWQTRGQEFVAACQASLWSPQGRQALDWLRERGLTVQTIREAGLGLNQRLKREAPALWGLERDKPIYLPYGIVIPWWIDGELWRINIRRFSGSPKYIGPAGCGNGLYGADALQYDQPAVMVEGEFDALTVMQESNGTIAAVATGSTSGSRRPRWFGQLALARPLLVAFDADDGGEKAADYWLRILPQARRWRPYWEDVNAMLRDGVAIQEWLGAGLNKQNEG